MASLRRVPVAGAAWVRCRMSNWAKRWDMPSGCSAVPGEHTEKPLAAKRQRPGAPGVVSAADSSCPDPQQATLWPHWRYHAFITNRSDLDTASGATAVPSAVA